MYSSQMHCVAMVRLISDDEKCIHPILRSKFCQYIVTSRSHSEMFIKDKQTSLLYNNWLSGFWAMKFLQNTYRIKIDEGTPRSKVTFDTTYLYLGSIYAFNISL
jgi:hypothetical protein